MRYAHFDPVTRIVIGWIDTKAQDGELPPKKQLIKVSDDEWERQDSPAWVLPNGSLFWQMPANDLQSLSDDGWQDDPEKQRAHALALRQMAYRSESDPLFIEWQYDQTDDAEQAWRDKVKEIKDRYPLP